MSLYQIVKNLAFQLPPEAAHNTALNLMKAFPSMAFIFKTGIYKNNSKYRLKKSGIDLNFPVIVAAGLDKNAQAVEFLSNLGFGSIEVGTVTVKPQAGNSKPRMWRYPEKNMIRNAMGFPSDGADILESNLSKISDQIPIGINIGKNKNTPNELAHIDYIKLYQRFKSKAAYLVINISSPNTPGLRELQNKDSLEKLLSEVTKQRLENDPPLYLKIAPDMQLSQIDEVIELSIKYKLCGIVATNTSINHSFNGGGISGEPIYEKSNSVREYLLSKTKNIKGFEIIGVGGFSHAHEFIDFWKKGGSFIQIYTSFIYKGPQILKEVKNAIDIEVKSGNFKNAQEWFDSL